MKKNSVIHARCTQQQKLKIEKRAEKAGLTSSEYVIMCAMNGRPKGNSGRKDMIRTVTQFQKSINDMEFEVEKLKNDGKIVPGNIVTQLCEIQEGVDELWLLLK